MWLAISAKGCSCFEKSLLSITSYGDAPHFIQGGETLPFQRTMGLWSFQPIGRRKVEPIKKAIETIHHHIHEILESTTSAFPELEADLWPFTIWQWWTKAILSSSTMMSPSSIDLSVFFEQLTGYWHAPYRERRTVLLTDLEAAWQAVKSSRKRWSTSSQWHEPVSGDWKWRPISGWAILTVWRVASTIEE